MRWLKSHFHGACSYAASTALVVIMTVLGNFIKGTLEPTNLVVFYLLVVVIAALWWGRGPAILSSVLGVLAFDFFLVPPYLTFGVASIHYLFTFAGLLGVGLVVSTLASRMRERAIEAHTREVQAAALYRLADDLANSDALAGVLDAVRTNVGHLFSCDVGIYLEVNEVLELSDCDHCFRADEHEKMVIARVLEAARLDRSNDNAFYSTRRHHIPLRTPEGVLGVLSISFRRHRIRITREEMELMTALASQAAIAIQRARLAEASRQIELMRQTERFQAALLNSISHDLRTPLVSITGALSTLLNNTARLNDSTRTELLETAHGEADRLNRFVGNLLDMTGMEAGAVRASKKPGELRDVLATSLDQFKGEIADRELRMEIPADFPELPMDFLLMIKVFSNLIDNAVKFSPAGTPIHIKAGVIEDQVNIEIKDQGFGIPRDDIERIFEKFYRTERSRQAAGTGLGLAICKGIVEAHGGKITARNNVDKGATFVVTLPLGKRSP